MTLNPITPIVGLVEGTALKVTGNEIKLIGTEHGFVFKNGIKTKVKPNKLINELL